MGIGGLIEAGAAGAALLTKKGNYNAAGSNLAISPPFLCYTTAQNYHAAVQNYIFFIMP